MSKNLSGDLLYEILRSYDANKLSNNNYKYLNSNEYLIGKHLEKALEDKDSNFKYYFTCGITHELAPDNPVIIIHVGKDISKDTEEEISRNKSESQIYGRTSIEEWKESNGTDPTNREPILELVSVQSERSEKLFQCFEEYRNKLSGKEQEEVNQAIDGISNITLFEAIKRNDIDRVRRLVKDVVNIRIKNEVGKTPLHIAVEKWRTKVVKELLNHGADINAVDKNGRTALFVASHDNHLEIVRALLENNANTNLATRTGLTPLLTAASRSTSALVKELLNHGANINAVDENGWTALRFVVQCNYNNLAIILTLLECKNINVNIPDKNGLTPLHLAVNCDRKDASKVIIQHLVENKADKPDYLEGEYLTYWKKCCEEKLLTKQMQKHKADKPSEPNSNFSTESVEAGQHSVNNL